MSVEKIQRMFRFSARRQRALNLNIVGGTSIEPKGIQSPTSRRVQSMNSQLMPATRHIAATP
jgi:hypothetical protein